MYNSVTMQSGSGNEHIRQSESPTPGSGGPQKPGQPSPKPPKEPMWKQVLLGNGKNFWANLLSTLIIFLIFISIFSYLTDDQAEPEDRSISEIAAEVKAGAISEIVVKGDELEIKRTDETDLRSKKERGTALSETLTNYGVTPEQLEGVKIVIQDESGFRYWFGVLAPLLIPLIIFIVIIWFIMRQVRGAGMQAFTFGQSKARMIDPKDSAQRVTFKDVAGAKEAKEELAEIVDFLKNPKKFLDIGARIPKGIILMGSPGTGKTLLARAVAGEAGVPFFSISGSEFVEMFVGVGASRVRDLFKMAKTAAPAIIFVDEIDAVGRVRGTGVGGGNDEREQTLNQILVEMDGFEPNEKVIVMAATNRPDVLDPALLRPGRFDRRTTIDLPDRDDREQILKIHAAKKPLAEDVNLKLIAERTPGFSGADLYSLMNEGAILAARENRKKVAQFDLIRSIEKVMLGPERKSHVLNKKEKEITAYHEAGHALVGSVLPHCDPVHKISIISRGRAAGYTLNLPFEDRKMQTKKQFQDQIAMSLGGYVAERMKFDDLTTGPSNDLQVLTSLARSMVTRWGMSDSIGPIALDGDGGRVMFGRGIDGSEHSEKVEAQIDAEVKAIIDEAYRRAEEVLRTHEAAFEAVSKKLIEVETLERDDYEKILIQHGIEPKRQESVEKEIVKEAVEAENSSQE